MKAILAAAATAAATVALATSVHAAITVDGTTRDADYGAKTSSVTANPTAPTSNFGAPTSENAIAYDIYLHDEGGKLYGFLQAGSDITGVKFSNLYFDLDPANGNGSDLGFEVGNDRAFVPNMPGYAESLPGITWAFGANSFEFSISNDYFKGPIAGLTYYPGQEFPGGKVVLRLSQSFGYSVAGGGSYGADRLGAFGVPEPASWALMVIGFLGAGATLRARRRQIA